MSDFIDEDGNDVEVSFQLQAELFADEVLESLNSQHRIINGERTYLAGRVEKLNELLASVDEKDEYRKVQLSEQIRWAEDSEDHLRDRHWKIEQAKESVKIARGYIVAKPEPWMLAPGEHEEWISWQRAWIAKAVGECKW